jgi:putative PIN family toxin of toxin-antitoxin system
MRAVVDTGVLVSALIRPLGVTGGVLRAVRDGRFTPVFSVPMLIELIEVLSRPSIQEKYGVTAEAVTALIQLLRLRGELVQPGDPLHACRDPKDDKFLDAAIAGQVDAIVSGDADLLDLDPFQSIPILRVSEFLAQI